MNCGPLSFGQFMAALEFERHLKHTDWDVCRGCGGCRRCGECDCYRWVR